VASVLSAHLSLLHCFQVPRQKQTRGKLELRQKPDYQVLNKKQQDG
jgi:hypothetical protein